MCAFCETIRDEIETQVREEYRDVSERVIRNAIDVRMSELATQLLKLLKKDTGN